MRKAEKEFHMTAFPFISDRTMGMMQTGNRSANYAVFLAYSNNLYIRCFHRYCTGKLLENNRYVFTESGCCRYGLDSGERWKIRKTVIEPVFTQFPFFCKLYECRVQHYRYGQNQGYLHEVQRS